MTKTPYEYIDSDDALAGLVADIEDAKIIALDTEANSLYNYFERVCLIQLTVGKRHYIVDPLSDIDMKPFLKALAVKPLILHGVDFDLRLMRSSFGFKPRADVYDTMLAAQLLGFERFGYAALVEEYVGVTLAKAGQKSNWARRPLTQAQLHYAVDDTHYLQVIRDELDSELRELGRESWHEEWCQKIVKGTQKDSERDVENAWRIKGLNGLNRKELAYVRAIWHWRDAEARRTDRPAFKILGNEALTKLAIWAGKHPNGRLKNGPALPRNCAGRRQTALKVALEEVRAMPRTEWPPMRKRNPNPANDWGDYKPQTDALRRECADVAHDLGISPAVLAPKAMLASIARHNARTRKQIRECSPMMEWQMDLLVETIDRVLQRFKY